jgi:hypothetical protein
MRGLGIALTLALASLAPAAIAQPGTSASAPAAAGSAQRRAILDALRPAVERRLGPNIEFVVQSIRVRDGWATVHADPQRRGGGRIDPRRYLSPEQLEFSDGLGISAVLRHRAGRWQLVEHRIGATDVWYCGSDVWPADVGRRFGC